MKLPENLTNIDFVSHADFKDIAKFARDYGKLATPFNLKPDTFGHLYLPVSPFNIRAIESQDKFALVFPATARWISDTYSPKFFKFGKIPYVNLTLEVLTEDFSPQHFEAVRMDSDGFITQPGVSKFLGNKAVMVAVENESFDEHIAQVREQQIQG